MSETPTDPATTYSYLGPAGTFTESALAQVEEARGKTWRAVRNVGEALDDVITGRCTAAMIAIENSIEGGVSATQDALAGLPQLRIVGEYLVNVSFILVAKPGRTLESIRTINAHPVAYAQCRSWLDEHIPAHGHIPAASNVQAAESLFVTDSPAADAAIAPPGIIKYHHLDVLADSMVSNSNAITRFVLVARDRPLPDRTGADKTSIIAELPADEPGSLLKLLEQFSTRGVNLSLIESRPIGDELGRYRFVIDLDGHVFDERVADALLGVRRFSPKVIFLGSYPRADRQQVEYVPRYDDEVFIEARDWLRGLISGEPTAD